MILDVPPKLPDNPTRFMNQLRTLVRQQRWSNFYYTHVVRKGGFGVRSPIDEAF